MSNLTVTEIHSIVFAILHACPVEKNSDAKVAGYISVALITSQARKDLEMDIGDVGVALFVRQSDE